MNPHVQISLQSFILTTINFFFQKQLISLSKHDINYL